MMAGILAVAAIAVLAFDIASVVEWPWMEGDAHLDWWEGRLHDCESCSKQETAADDDVEAA